MEDIIKDYIERLNAIHSTGNYTEHSFRGIFADFCQAILNNDNPTNETYSIINEPKRKDYGAPDFEIIKSDTTYGFIETKNIGDTDLRGQKATQNKIQFDKYKSAISSIAFSDYLSIVYFKDGQEVLDGRLAIEKDGSIILNENSREIDNFIKIVKKLGNVEPQPIKSAKTLAEKMSKKAKLIAEILSNAMKLPLQDQTHSDKDLQGKLDTFRKFLVHDMSVEQFVDFYAQTILYGLFIARIYDHHPESFSLTEASDLIPDSNPFLKRIFRDLVLANPHPFIRGILEDLVTLFKATNMKRVLRIYGKDPLVHFYEAFLEEYNPKIREDFGVWYTPFEVVSFIVNSVDNILRNDFGINDGLANNDLLDSGEHRVQILDPATGTGTFLAITAEKIYENYKGQEGLWNDDVVRHIIPRLNGFEYLVAPYTMAHLKLAMALKLESINEIPDRLNIFLTNSLEEDHPESQFDFARYITDESNAASTIKRDTPIMVIMGNPPYNENSANTGTWITNLMDYYKQEPGKERIEKRGKRGKISYKNTLKKKNAKGINNDYCKFIRLGHNFLNRNKEGVLAYICGNTFTKTNIFRGMRYQLLKDFDEIYVINLHGSSKFDESTVDVKDENIFNIMVGVSINIFVKRQDSQKTGLAKVYYKDIYGTRKQKLDFLANNKFQDIDFEIIKPDAPFFEITPKEEDYEILKKQYGAGFKLDLLMPTNKQGFISQKDDIVICNQKSDICQIIDALTSDVSEQELREKYGFKDNRDWKLGRARSSLKNNLNREKYITKVSYRPFDYRWTYLNKVLVTYPRPLIQESLLNRENIVICIGKQGTAIGNKEWSLIWISDLPTDINVNPRGGSYLFPLYLYKEGFAGRTYNFSDEIIEQIESNTGLKLQSEDSFERKENGFRGIDLIDYVYAILHSSKYRNKYHQFLQNDFPVIPYPNNRQYFLEIAKLGKQLRTLHLLKDISTSDFITEYPVSSGDNTVTKVKYESIDDSKGKIWINEDRYFNNVPLKSWEIFVSGYQPLQKWLSDRKGKTLSSDDIRHYQKMVFALTKTYALMQDINDLILL